MTDPDVLRNRIPDYAGYATEAARHQTDPQIRAYLGEALAGARDRIGVSAEPAERLDALLTRCQFTDMPVIRAAEHAGFSPEQIARIEAVDREIVACADRVRAAASPGDLEKELETAARLLDERYAALVPASPPGTGERPVKRS